MHLRRFWINRSVYEYFAVNVGPLVGWRNPILIYQMGGVGSSSIRNSLFRSRDPRTRLVLMSHEFLPVRHRNPDSIDCESRYRSRTLAEIEFDKRYFESLPLSRKLGLLLREQFYSRRIFRAFVQSGLPLKVITMVRDPVAANISLFFQVFGKYAGLGKSAIDFDAARLCRIFVDTYQHTRPLTWFDVELKANLHVDVYEHLFPTEIGQSVISAGNIELLVLRSELDDAVKSRAIGQFIDIEGFELRRSNVATDKPYANLYAEFKQQLRLPEPLLNDLYTSRYVRHFFSNDERDRFRSAWAYR